MIFAVDTDTKTGASMRVTQADHPPGIAIQFVVDQDAYWRSEPYIAINVPPGGEQKLDLYLYL